MVNSKTKKKTARGRRGNLFELDGPLWKAGFVRVVGVDEAGRGPLAGPVVAAAAVFEPRVRLRGLADSKKLTPDERDRLFDRIVERAVAFGIAGAMPEEIDELNIYQATHVAARRAIAQLGAAPDCLVTDMLKLHDLGVPCHPHPRADDRSHAVAAASVLAKVTRDRLMERYEEDFPGYGLARHKGYPTQIHREALSRLGPTTIHRWSYAPVREAAGITGISGSAEARRSLLFQRLSEEIAADRGNLEWECSRELWRSYLPQIEWLHLDALAHGEQPPSSVRSSPRAKKRIADDLFK